VEAEIAGKGGGQGEGVEATGVGVDGDFGEGISQGGFGERPTAVV